MASFSSQDSKQSGDFSEDGEGYSTEGDGRESRSPVPVPFNPELARGHA